MFRIHAGNFRQEKRLLWEGEGQLSCLHTQHLSYSSAFSLSLSVSGSQGGSGSLGSPDSNGQQDLQMAENLIYYSREEGNRKWGRTHAIFPSYFGHFRTLHNADFRCTTASRELILLQFSFSFSFMAFNQEALILSLLANLVMASLHLRANSSLPQTIHKERNSICPWGKLLNKGALWHPFLFQFGCWNCFGCVWTLTMAGGLAMSIPEP